MRWIYLLILICSTSIVCGQGTRRVEVEYIYSVPSNVSQDKAREIALYRAQLKAIAEEYGTYISQSNFTNISTSTDDSSIDFQTIGMSEVKGEWVETIGEPEYKAYFEQGMLVIKVKVKGRIRPITYARVEFSAKVLCNGTEDRFRSTKFKDGDEIFVKFSSPQNGYLAIYLIDNNNKNAYCLLPYQNAPNGIHNVVKGREYTLFSSQANPGIDYIDEYILTTDSGSETNQLYIIFSPNRFVKSNDSFSRELMPRHLSFDRFQEWLSSNRKRDAEMQVHIETLTIKK